MLILYKSTLVGLNLLLLMHIAYAFVLLTANMEDVKKLARKFVSESIADQIADFIAKATENMMNVSEHETNSPVAPENLHQVSEENVKYNIERHGLESAAQDALKSIEETIEKNKESFNSIETNRDTKLKKEDRKKVVLVDPFKGQSRYINSKSRHINKATEAKKKAEKDKNKYVKRNLDATAATKSKRKSKHEKYKLLSQLTSLEDNGVTDAQHFSNDNRTTPDEFPENEVFQKRALEIEMTTSKADAEEFDQYDSKKATLLATSGPMSLLIPRRSLGQEHWWDKEIPKPDTEQAKAR